jgi:hypothetical protein
VSPKRCFVIMPFSTTSKIHTKEYWDCHFKHLLKPIIESCNDLEAFRSEPLRQDILRQIINDLVFSPIVVADLTDNNPNVYWELGVRQSFRHSTITIAEESSMIPFDMASKGILFYSSEESEEKNNFEERFRQAIIDCLSHPDRSDSAVLETVTGRGSIYAVIHQRELVQRVEALISESDVNQIIVNQIYEKVYQNRGKRFSFIRGKDVITTRLGSSAINLLLAERYLEEDSKFYNFVHALHVMISAVNHHLATWDYQSSKYVEKWFFDHEHDFREMLQQHRKRLKIIHQKLLSAV